MSTPDSSIQILPSEDELGVQIAPNSQSALVYPDPIPTCVSITPTDSPIIVQITPCAVPTSAQVIPCLNGIEAAILCQDQFGVQIATSIGPQGPPGPASGGPGGANTDVQFNDSGSFGGNSGFVYNKTTQTVNLTHLVLTNALPILYGGTGATTQAGAANNILPAQSSNAGKFLQTDGTNVSWVNGNTGTVTSVSVVTANGVSGSVATATTTPAITLVLGDITPTSVEASGTVTGSNLSGVNTGDQIITLTGEVTGSGGGSFATTITTNMVTNAKLAQMATLTLKGNNTGSTANALDLTSTQVTAMLNLFTDSLQGLVPLSGGGTANYLRADGTWAPPPGATVGTVTSIDVSGGTTGLTTSGGPITSSGVITLDGILNIANGGTGASTAPLAFSALSPLTTKGDLLTYSTVNIRLAVGSNTQVLTADSTTATGLKWVTPTIGTVTSVSVVTANGVSGSVATATTTPAITLTLGAITPTSVAASGTVTGSNLSGTNTGDQVITLTGDVTGSGTGSFATTIGANKVLNSMLAQMPTLTIKGNNTGSTADPLDLTATQVTAMLNTFTSSLQGLAPSSGGGTANYLRADGTWAAPPGSTSGTVTSVSVVTANGVSGTVATATTTPAITLTLGAITPSSVTASGTVTGSNLSGTNTGDQTITLTGDVTGSGTGSFAATIAANAVTNAKLAQMVAHTFKGNNTGSTANALDLTATQLTAELNLFSSTLKGLTPLSGGGTTNYLRADGTWASPPGATSGTVTSIDVSGGTTGLTTSGGPITSSGTITLAGTLAIANGGTGQTTANPAFNALSPLTTKGDLIGYSTVNARLAVGTNGQVLTADSTATTGLKWATPTVGTVTSVSVVTANGVSGSVANATTTPAITLTLGAITPSSVVASGTVTGSNLSGTNTGDQVITLTSDVTGSGGGSFATTIAANVVTNSKLAQMAAHTFKGNNTASTANAIDLTATQLTAELHIFTSSLQGLAPSSGGGTTNYLRADGTWASPPGATSGTVTSVSVVTANGISGTVATSTTTPAITLTLGAITPTSVAATGALSGTGLTLSGLTPGSVIFAGASGVLSQDNSNLFWDAANKRLSVGTGASTLGNIESRTTAIAQFAASYDATHYTTWTTNSNGRGTFNSNGTDVFFFNATALVSNLHLGVGTSPNAAVKGIDVASTSTDWGTNWCQRNIATTSVTTNGTNFILALDMDCTPMSISAGVTDSGYRLGIRGQAYASSAGFAGTLARQYGIYGRVGINNGASSAVVQNAYCLYGDILADVSGATITNAYGLYIDHTSTVGTITNRWGISINTGIGIGQNYMSSTLLMGTVNVPTNAVLNLVLSGGATSPVIGNATADAVCLAAVDKAAADRRLYIQSEAGSVISLGNDRLNFAASTGYISINGTDAATITATSFLGAGSGQFTTLGVGASPNIAATIIASRSSTDPTFSQSVLNCSSTTNTITANNAFGFFGGQFDIRVNQAGFNMTDQASVRGFTCGVSTTGSSGTVTGIAGAVSQVNNTGAGTLTTGQGYQVAPAQNSGGGTFTNNIGFNVLPQTVGTNIYGFRGQIASTSGRWNLYMDGTADNYLAGNLSLGTTSASAKVHAVSTTEQLRIGYDTSNYVSYTVSSVGALTIANTGTNAGITLTPSGTGNVILSAIPRFNGTNSTGAGAALNGSNCPALTLTAPYTWIKVVTSDGSTAYIPCWK